MRAIGVKAFGGPEVLEVLSLEPGAPAAGQVRVKVGFAGVNSIDVHVRRGAFLGRERRPPGWPLVLGYEGAGTVESVGPNVAGVRAGDRVAWCGLSGACAELAIVPAWRLVLVPDAVPLDIACALQLDGAMAHALSVSVFPIKAGDRVLVQGAADSLALMLIRIAKAQGAEVIATIVREVEAGGPKAAGADHIVVMDGRDVAAEVREATRGEGCHVVYDGLGRDSFATSLACCRRRGVIVLHGGNSHPVETVRPDDLAAAGSVYVTRPHLADFLQDANEVMWRMDAVLGAWSAGRLEIGVGRVLPLEGAREAHLALEGQTPAGTILLRP
ncbi:MAG: quinone oxidoreductase [Hyphomicrobiaceae bacterium]